MGPLGGHTGFALSGSVMATSGLDSACATLTVGAVAVFRVTQVSRKHLGVGSVPGQGPLPTARCQGRTPLLSQGLEMARRME